MSYERLLAVGVVATFAVWDVWYFGRVIFIAFRTGQIPDNNYLIADFWNARLIGARRDLNPRDFWLGISYLAFGAIGLLFFYRTISCCRFEGSDPQLINGMVRNAGFDRRTLFELVEQVALRRQEIERAWHEHFR
jgi:hypothetical protein